MKDDKLYLIESTNPCMSAGIVKRLQKEGYTLRDIGNMMGGLTHSFLSQVRSGKRSLTMARLERLEKALGRPLPIIFLQAEEESSKPNELRKAYRLIRKQLREVSVVRGLW